MRQAAEEGSLRPRSIFVIGGYAIETPSQSLPCVPETIAYEVMPVTPGLPALPK